MQRKLLSLAIVGALANGFASAANAIAPAALAPNIDTRFRSRRKRKGRSFFKLGYGNRQSSLPRNGKRERYRRVGHRLGFCGKRAIAEGERYLRDPNAYYDERAA